MQGFRFLFLSCSFGSLAVTSKSESPPLFDRAIALSLIKPDQIPPIFRLSLQFVSKWALTFGLKIPLSGHPSTYPPSTPIPIHISTHTSTPNTCIVHTHIIAFTPTGVEFFSTLLSLFPGIKRYFIQLSCVVDICWSGSLANFQPAAIQGVKMKESWRCWHWQAQVNGDFLSLIPIISQVFYPLDPISFKMFLLSPRFN